MPHLRRPRVWIDIENPPQVQYLTPFVEVFEKRGADVVITARDYGNTLELLGQRTTAFITVGGEFGRSRTAKLVGVMRRAQALNRLFRQTPKPDVLVCSSRPATLVARRLRIAAFVMVDYEYADLRFYRLTRSFVLYPDAIDTAVLTASGIRPQQLIPFGGLKEDISFGNVDVKAVVPHTFREIRDASLVRVLFRPPAERSHYFNPESRELALTTLAHLAAQKQSVVILAPRHPDQETDLRRFSWQNEPIVLRRAVPFVSLLKGVDLVVGSGGTMLREAAYLGLPSYDIFKSRIGGVDGYIVSIGRMHLIQESDELREIALRKAPPLSPLHSASPLVHDLAEQIHARVPALGFSAERNANANVIG
jgi:uncharacterized protein